jgi:hypothetical protein
MHQVDTHIHEAIKNHKEFEGCDLTALTAITLWSSHYVFKKLNSALREDKDISLWRPYINALLAGLRNLEYSKGTCFRGLTNYRDVSEYKKNAFIRWPAFSAMSKDKSKALKFAKNNGLLFEVEVLSGRDISKLSMYPHEKEVLLMPYSQFEVVDVIEDEVPVVVKLREVCMPRGLKVIFWVDDTPENNFKEILKMEKESLKMEKENLSIVCCRSTDEAFKLLEAYSWLLYLKKADLRIVTDMVRVEGGKKNYFAGLDLVQRLRKEYNYKYQVLIYCADEIQAKQNCVHRGLIDEVYATSSKSKLQKFIQFKKFDGFKTSYISAFTRKTV